MLPQHFLDLKLASVSVGETREDCIGIGNLLEIGAVKIVISVASRERNVA